MKPTFRICDLCGASFSLPDDSCQEEQFVVEVPNTADNHGYDMCHECVKKGLYEASKRLGKEVQLMLYGLVSAWAHGVIRGK